MKIFISHKSSDAGTAETVARRLRSHRIACYLDVVDSKLGKAGEDLGTYFRQVLGQCSHLLAVVSASTAGSWWVPWEIGVATEKDYPLATYAPRTCTVPDYLKKWPYLQSDSDLDAYAKAAIASSQLQETKARTMMAAAAQRESTGSFYSQLRAVLRQ